MQRKKFFKERENKMLNPYENFDPDNFEPLATPDEREVLYRKRIKPGKTLPTFGLKPKEVLEGQMIGMYESKQDIYLILAHRCNDLQSEVDELRAKIAAMELAIKQKK